MLENNIDISSMIITKGLCQHIKALNTNIKIKQIIKKNLTVLLIIIYFQDKNLNKEWRSKYLLPVVSRHIRANM